jgi:hypothetical protein
MMTDFRALCTEILDILDDYENDLRVDWDDWRTRARAALSKKESDQNNINLKSIYIEQLAQIIYEEAIIANAPEYAQPYWPKWNELPDSEARQNAIHTAEKIYLQQQESQQSQFYIPFLEYKFKNLCIDLLAVFDLYDDESNLAGIFDDLKSKKNDIINRARFEISNFK